MSASIANRRQAIDQGPAPRRPLIFEPPRHQGVLAAQRSTRTTSDQAAVCQGTASLIDLSSRHLFASLSRAMVSIIGQFCRKNAVASEKLAACTFTLQACLAPLSEI
jgi:hypothetical protein